MPDVVELTGANQKTGWWDISTCASAVCFNLDGDFIEAVSVQYSNDPAYAKDANSIRTDATTYSAPAGPLQLPFGVAKFVRFATGGSWTAGKKCSPRFSTALNSDGKLYTPSVQQNITAPVTA